MAPKLSQEEFDEVVRTNKEDFGMEDEEAVSSAVEEFQLQGYSLDGIIKSASGGNTDGHPIALATHGLAELANNAAGVQLAGLQAGVDALQQQFEGLAGPELQQAVAVAAKEGSVAALLAAARAALSLEPQGGDQLQAVLLACLGTLRVLMQLPDCRASFVAEGGAELLHTLTTRCCDALAQQPAGAAACPAEAAQLEQQYALAAATAALAEAAAWQDEEGKCRLVDCGFAADLLQLLRHLGCSEGSVQALPAAASAAGAAAGALRAFTTADDSRPPASKAFMHARLLAGQPHDALQALLPVVQQLGQAGSGPRPVAHLVAALGAVKQLAANDEICKAFSEAGGVAALQQLLAAATEDGPPELVRATAGALRQLANSDGIKQELAQGGALATLLRAVRVYSGAQPAVQEQLLGLLVALVLRMPDIAAAAAEAGAVDVLTEVLAAAPAMAAAAKAAAGNGASGKPGKAAAAAAPDDVASRVFGVGVAGGGNGNGNGRGSGAAVQRQACMAVRNMVVRNPELRAGFLAAGAEQQLRGVKALFPGACKDVASAALRDLGLADYNN